MGVGVMAKNSNQQSTNAKSQSVEDIVRADWERNYKESGIPLNTVRSIVKIHADEQKPIFRFGNTLILLTPRGNYDMVKFHTITDDSFKVYMATLLQFFISLCLKKGTEIAYTTVNDEKIYNSIKKMFGDFVSLEPNNEEPEKGKYLLTFQVGPFVREMQSKQAMGVPNGLG